MPKMTNLSFRVDIKIEDGLFITPKLTDFCVSYEYEEEEGNLTHADIVTAIKDVPGITEFSNEELDKIGE